MTTRKQRKSRLHFDAHIAIVGGGIGGLATALALQNTGFRNVKVYERDTDFSSRRDGYGLTLTYNVTGPLQQLGILEKVAQEDTPSRSHYIFTSRGEILGYFGNAFIAHRGIGQRGNLRVPRQTVRRIMMDELHDGTIIWEKRLLSYTEEVNEKHEHEVILSFEDETVEIVELLIGADGVNSAVAKQQNCHMKHNNDGSALCTDTLSYLGVMIILGISTYEHSLLNERGFYTLDGTHRLFTMPFEGGNRYRNFDDDDDDNRAKTKARTMWQLSYRLDSKEEANRLSQSGPQRILEEVMQRCKDWHEPVPQMLAETPLDSVWGTGLMDRIPKPVHSKRAHSSKNYSRVVVLGDAKHAMSPFKGQGANQALSDATLLASWLTRASIDSALLGFERDMILRTSKQVQASREAAAFYHSEDAIQDTPKFAGVRVDCIPLLLAQLRTQNVTASLGSSLDDSVRKIIHDMELVDDKTISKASASLSEKDVQDLQAEALNFAADGDTEGLRVLSIKHASYIASARNEGGETCLHLAAKGGHSSVCRWLVYEVRSEINCRDRLGRSPIDVALLAENDIDIIPFLQNHYNFQKASTQS